MMKHKQALYEILTAAMAEGQPLHGYCEKVFKTASEHPSGESRFISLGNFIVSDVVVGRVKDKYTGISQDILCVAALDTHHLKEAESDAEAKAFELARKVRTLLRSNQTLASASYPNGIARSTWLRGTPVEPIMYGESHVFLASVTILITMEEDET